MLWGMRKQFLHHTHRFLKLLIWQYQNGNVIRWSSKSPPMWYTAKYFSHGGTFQYSIKPLEFKSKENNQCGYSL